jgi:large subunit ribosomal protein L10e
MGLRPAHCYRGTDKPAYTRIAVTVHHKNFIGTNPNLHTRQFNMGNPLKKYTHIVDLVCEQPHVQIRDNALEAARLNVNRHLINSIGKENFFMRLRVYPYHIMRENKLAQGAGADRVSSGMKHAFGKPIGKAARLRQGQKVFSVLCDETQLDAVKRGLLRAIPKMGLVMSVNAHQDILSIGTLPKKMREEKVEVKAEEATAEAGEGADATAAPAAGGKEGAPAAKGAPAKGTPAKDAKGVPAKDAKGTSAGKDAKGDKGKDAKKK